MHADHVRELVNPNKNGFDSESFMADKVFRHVFGSGLLDLVSSVSAKRTTRSAHAQ